MRGRVDFWVSAGEDLVDGPQGTEMETQEERQVGQEASLGHAGWLQAGSGDGTSWARKTKPFVLGFHIHSLGWCPARKAQPPSPQSAAVSLPNIQHQGLPHQHAASPWFSGAPLLFPGGVQALALPIPLPSSEAGNFCPCSPLGRGSPPSFQT